MEKPKYNLKNGDKKNRVRLFRQLMLRPIARDPRVPIKWRHGTKPGVKYDAELTGSAGLLKANKDKFITINWIPKHEGLLGAGEKPKLRVEPRAPNGVDMLVLFCLIREVIYYGNPARFPSFMSMRTRLLKGGTHGFYHRSLWDSLRLWQQLGVTWPDLNMPPPITSIELNPQKGYDVYSYTITLDAKWLALCKQSHYFTALPVPKHATAQNIVLYTLAKGGEKKIHINDFFYRVSGNAKARGNRIWCSLEPLITVEKWYAARSGHFDFNRFPFTKSPTSSRWKPSQFIGTLVRRPGSGGLSRKITRKGSNGTAEKATRAAKGKVKGTAAQADTARQG